MKTSMRNLLLNLAAIGLLALFLVWAETNLDGYKVQILNLIAVNAILALSLNLIYGFTGMFSLGHAGFMAIGAYVSALCVLPAAQKEMMWILEDIIWPFSVIHTPFWFSVVAGGFVAAIFGLFIAIPVLRLGGDYLGIATLGFAEIIRVLIVNLTPITNGSLGIKGIPFHASLLVNYGWLLITLYAWSSSWAATSATSSRPSATTKSPRRSWASTPSGPRCSPSASARSSRAWAGRCSATS